MLSVQPVKVNLLCDRGDTVRWALSTKSCSAHVKEPGFVWVPPLGTTIHGKEQMGLYDL